MKILINKTGQDRPHLALLEDLINSFVSGRGVCDGPRGTSGKELLQKGQQLSWLPLFDSFFRDHIDAVKNQRYSKYNKENPIRQGQVLEEITCKSDADNVFSKITEDFCRKLPCFFFKKMAHTQLLWLVSEGISSARETAANLADQLCLRIGALGVTRHLTNFILL